MKALKKGVFRISAVVAAVLVCMIISTVESDKNRIISDATGIIAKPIQKVFVTISDWIDYGGDYFHSMDELKEENARLKSQVMLLEGKITESDSVRSENERLRTLADLKEKNKEYNMTGASVTAIDPSGWYSYFIIDKGTNDGINKNSVVLDSGGVIGRIDKIGSNWARVATIIEPGTACGAEVSRTGDLGIIEGDSALNGFCKMTSIGKETNITPGDYIITSGSGDVYPPGLTIGRVREINDGEISRTAIIEPTGNVKSPKEVMVILSTYSSDYKTDYNEE